MGKLEYVDNSPHTSNDVNAPRLLAAVGALIHTTAGKHSLAWLQGASARAGTPASADYLIDRDGTIHKISPAGRYAYHAGIARFKWNNKLYEHQDVSQKLIGIELEQAGEEDVTREQYESLADLLRKLAQDWAWQGDFPLVGHYSVARPRGRRSDPCNFDWGVLRAMMRDAAVQLPLPRIGE